MAEVARLPLVEDGVDDGEVEGGLLAAVGAVLEGGLEGQQIVMVRRRPGSEEPDGRMVFADIGPSGFESRWEVPGADGGWTVANRARFTRR